MSKFNKPKLFKLLLGVLLFCTLCSLKGQSINNEQSEPILIKTNQGQGDPNDSSIQASINGHTLTVIFTENLGQVTVEVSRTSGGETQVESTPTPNGVLFYIYDTGSYIVTFTLPNGDEYYGEFEVTN